MRPRQRRHSVDITQRNRLELTGEISSVIAKGGSLTNLLRACAESLVRHLRAAFGRIWILNEREQVLELLASAGMYTHLDGRHSRVAVGQFKIGRIVQERKPHLTNAVIGDPAVHDQEWAKREGMVAFAGYPLLAEGRVVGVMAIFAKHPLSQIDLQAMGSVADVLAVGIQRSRDEDHLKASQEALQEATRKLNEAQRIAHVGHWEHDLDTDRITASDEMYRIFGLRPNENFQTWAAWQEYLLHPEDRAIGHVAVAQPLREGSRYESAYRVVRPDGDIRIIHSHSEVTRDAAGRPCRLFGIVQDITERRRAEEAQRTAEQRLRHVVASSPAVLFTLRVEDGEFRGINWISENIQAMLGYQVGETLGEAWWTSSIHPEDRDTVLDQWRSGIRSHECCAAEYRIRHKDGAYRWIRGETRLFRTAAGELSELVGSLSDISERKRLEGQLLQAQKMEAIGQLTGGIAHDFNNLLTVINGCSELSLMTLEAGDPRRPNLELVKEAGARGAALIRQLLAFSRKQVLEPRVLDLNAVVSNLEEMLRRTIGEDVTVRHILKPGLGRVRADPLQIEQILMNLAVNARDAMPQGGRLTIETADVELDEYFARTHAVVKPGPYVMLAVSDTGCGMDEEVQKHIFDPFFTTKGQGKGTGLGLSTVYGIVKQSGGSIWVYSEMGQGTTFKVYLPKVEEEADAVLPGAERVASLKGTETILLVEDDEPLRKLTSSILQHGGYQVLQTSSRTEALQVCGRHQGPIHLILTDVVMPGIPSLEFTSQLSSIRPDTRTLYMSGYPDDTVTRHGVLLQGVAFLQKPFSVDGLLRKLRAVLDRPEWKRAE